MLVGSQIKPGSFFIDPGFWCTFTYSKGTLNLATGIVSSYPDIRGLPNPGYRNSIDKTYMITPCVEHTFGRTVTVSMEPYWRYRDRAPNNSYESIIPVWDDSIATPLYSRGINYRLSLDIGNILDVDLAGMAGASHRIVDGECLEYEWNVPWSVKSFLPFHFPREVLHLHLNAIFSDGIPFRDPADNNRLKRGNIYFRPDITVEYRNTTIEHRQFTRYDLYLGILNFARIHNGGEPYWGITMQRNTINLTPLMIVLGGRFAFRH
jgi:hypothetical protein